MSSEFGPLFGVQPPGNATFDGETIVAGRDHERLRSLLQRVFDLMRDGGWRTLPEIVSVAGGTEASVSARLRDLRKDKFGNYDVDREHVGGGLFRYRLVLR